jgi:hypothetical protein
MRYEDVEVLQIIKARAEDAKYTETCYRQYCIAHERRATNVHAGSENKLDIPNKREKDLLGAD